MKKVAAILLAICLVLSLCACGSKASGVTIENFESQVIKELFGEETLSVTENDSGFSFEYKGSVLLSDLTISGAADKNKNITEIKVEAVDGLNIDYFNSLTAEQFLKDVGDVNNVPINKLAGDMLLWDCSFIVKTCSSEQSAEDQLYGLDLLLAARNSPQEKDGWTYSIATNKNAETITFTAIYGK